MKDSEHLGQLETKKLHSIFGAFPASSGTKACHIINTIKHLIPLEKLDQALRNRTTNEPREQPKEFGDGITFHFPKRKHIEITELWSSDSDDENVSKVDDLLRLKHKSPLETEQETKTVESSIKCSWLMDACEKHAQNSTGGLGADDLFSALFDMLSSERSSEDIQNDLLELLGFDSIELITNLLKERYYIVNAILDGPGKEWY